MNFYFWGIYRLDVEVSTTDCKTRMWQSINCMLLLTKEGIKENFIEECLTLFLKDE